MIDDLPLEQVLAYARRYYWLRAQHWSDGDCAVITEPAKRVMPGAFLPSLDLLDRWIDQRMVEERT